jgi:hypothetical protein
VLQGYSDPATHNEICRYGELGSQLDGVRGRVMSYSGRQDMLRNTAQDEQPPFTLISFTLQEKEASIAADVH